jgi:hypothetical protein
LHRHPRIGVLETTTSKDGEHIIVQAEMDSDAYLAYIGQKWHGDDGTTHADITR